MFVRVKTKNYDKISNHKNVIEYNFYICERYRENKKIISKDYLVFSKADLFLKEADIDTINVCIKLSIAEITFHTKDDNIHEKIMSKIINIKEALNEKDNTDEKEQEAFKEGYRQAKRDNSITNFSKAERKLLNKFYKDLAKIYHPDKSEDNTVAEMQLLNKLKKIFK